MIDLTPRIVTPEQYAEGYSVLLNETIIRRSWRLVHRLPDGNYVVTYWPDEVDDSPDRIPIIDAR